MASLRDTVKDYQDELRDGIAWVAFWKQGRSWNAEYFHLDMDDTLYPEDRSRLEEIKSIDPAAVILNGYYCGHLGEDMSLDELTAGVRYHYENSMNDIDGFIGAHDDRLPPEVIEEARAAAHEAGLPFSEKPYRDGEDFNPYVFDGSMSIEDYELMHRMMEQERREKMSEQFSILIDSRTRFETGEPGGVWLPMPTTTEQLHAAMESVGITADNPQDFFINGFANTEQQPFDVPLPVIQSAGIDELNYLAHVLSDLDQSDIEKFEAVIDSGEYTGSVHDLINLAQNLECYDFYPGIDSEEALGRAYIEEMEMLDVPDNVLPYFDFEAYGRDVRINEGGHFAPGGYVFNNGGSFVERYHGMEDIPPEHRIFAYPKLNIREQMAAYQEVIDRSALNDEKLRLPASREDR